MRRRRVEGLAIPRTAYNNLTPARRERRSERSSRRSCAPRNAREALLAGAPRRELSQACEQRLELRRHAARAAIASCNVGEPPTRSQAAVGREARGSVVLDTSANKPVRWRCLFSTPLLAHGTPRAVRLVPESTHAAARAPIQRRGRLPGVEGEHEGALCQAVPGACCRQREGKKRQRSHAYRLLRSSTSSRRTGTTVGSTSGQMLAMSGSLPVCGPSTVVKTVCSRSRLRGSSAAPVYLVTAVLPSGKKCRA